MIEEQAEVTRVDRDLAWVRCRAQRDCVRCAEGRGCGGGLLGKLLGDRLHLVQVTHAGDIQPGDCVRIGLPESVLLRATLAVYGMPLAGLFAGAVLATWAGGGNEAVVILGGASGMAAGIFWMRAFSRRIRGDRRYQPAVLRRVAVTERG